MSHPGQVKGGAAQLQVPEQMPGLTLGTQDKLRLWLGFLLMFAFVLFLFIVLFWD